MCVCVYVSPKAPDEVSSPACLFRQKTPETGTSDRFHSGLMLHNSRSCLLTFAYGPRLFDMISDCPIAMHVNNDSPFSPAVEDT